MKLPQPHIYQSKLSYSSHLLFSSNYQHFIYFIHGKLYFFREISLEIQQKHFRNTLVQEIVDCLLLGSEERFEEWGIGVGPQGTGCSEFAIAHFLDSHYKGLVRGNTIIHT